MESLDSYEEIAHDDHNTELREETANLGYWSWVAELSNVPFDFFYMQYEKRVKDNGGSMVLEAHSGATCFFFSFLFFFCTEDEDWGSLVCGFAPTQSFVQDERRGPAQGFWAV
jgi:hypothetical protein